MYETILIKSMNKQSNERFVGGSSNAANGPLQMVTRLLPSPPPLLFKWHINVYYAVCADLLNKTKTQIIVDLFLE